VCDVGKDPHVENAAADSQRIERGRRGLGPMKSPPKRGKVIRNVAIKQATRQPYAVRPVSSSEHTGRKRDGCQPLFRPRRNRVVSDAHRFGARRVRGVDDVAHIAKTGQVNRRAAGATRLAALPRHAGDGRCPTEAVRRAAAFLSAERHRNFRIPLGFLTKTVARKER
jgi:hypothetical protein